MRPILLLLVLTLCSELAMGAENCEECEQRLEQQLFKALLDENNVDMVELQNTVLTNLCQRLHPGDPMGKKECVFTLPRLWTRIAKELFGLDGVYGAICGLSRTSCDQWKDWEQQGQCRKCKDSLASLINLFDNDSSVAPALVAHLSGDALCVPICEPGFDAKTCLDRCINFLDKHLEKAVNALTYALGRRAQVACNNIFELQGC